MDVRVRELRRELGEGWSVPVYEAYIRAVERAGLRLCGCENIHCSGSHRPGDLEWGPGHCLNLVDPRVSVVYVSLCDSCAVNLPDSYHLEECSCSRCSGGGGVDQVEVASLMEPEDFGHEDWESGEFEALDEPDEWSWGARGDV